MSAIHLYTIVDRRTSQPFVLRFRSKPVVIAFKAFESARYTACAIERRESVLGTMAESNELVATATSDEEPQNHFVEAWESYNTFVEACREQETGVLICTHLNVCPGEAIEFMGHIDASDV